MKYTVKPVQLLWSVTYDEIEYCVCESEQRAIVICSALNDCRPALAHALGLWLEARTCASCGERLDHDRGGHSCTV